MSGQRIRLSTLAGELGLDFPGLFSQFCRTCPEVIDTDITVPAGWLPALQMIQRTRDRKVA